MKTLKQILSAAMLIGFMLYAPNAMAQTIEQWYLITDKGDEIPVTNKTYLTDATRTFSIYKLGETVYQNELVARNVRKITFAKKSSTGITQIDKDEKNVQLSIESSAITVTNLKPAETVSIFTSAGAKITDKKADAQGTAKIMTGNMPSGIYILKTTNTNIQFIKK